MRRFILMVAGVAAALGVTAAVAAHSTPAYVTAAINDAARPDDDKKLDEERLPAHDNGVIDYQWRNIDR